MALGRLTAVCWCCSFPALLVAAGGCVGAGQTTQSALHPAGPQSSDIRQLFSFFLGVSIVGV